MFQWTIINQKSTLSKQKMAKMEIQKEGRNLLERGFANDVANLMDIHKEGEGVRGRHTVARNITNSYYACNANQQLYFFSFTCHLRYPWARNKKIIHTCTHPLNVQLVFVIPTGSRGEEPVD